MTWGTNEAPDRHWSFADQFVLFVLEERVGPTEFRTKRAELYVESLAKLHQIDRQTLERELLRFGIRVSAVDAVQRAEVDDAEADEGLPVMFELKPDGAVEAVWLSRRRRRSWAELRARLIEKSRRAS
jgi:hypothetical protein